MNSTPRHETPEPSRKQFRMPTPTRCGYGTQRLRAFSHITGNSTRNVRIVRAFGPFRSFGSFRGRSGRSRHGSDRSRQRRSDRSRTPAKREGRYLAETTGRGRLGDGATALSERSDVQRSPERSERSERSNDLSVPAYCCGAPPPGPPGAPRPGPPAGRQSLSGTTATRWR